MARWPIPNRQGEFVRRLSVLFCSVIDDASCALTSMSRQRSVDRLVSLSFPIVHDAQHSPNCYLLRQMSLQCRASNYNFPHPGRPFIPNRFYQASSYSINPCERNLFAAPQCVFTAHSHSSLVQQECGCANTDLACHGAPDPASVASKFAPSPAALEAQCPLKRHRQQLPVRNLAVSK